MKVGFVVLVGSRQVLDLDSVISQFLINRSASDSSPTNQVATESPTSHKISVEFRPGIRHRARNLGGIPECDVLGREGLNRNLGSAPTHQLGVPQIIGVVTKRGTSYLFGRPSVEQSVENSLHNRSKSRKNASWSGKAQPVSRHLPGRTWNFPSSDKSTT